MLNSLQTGQQLDYLGPESLPAKIVAIQTSSGVYRKIRSAAAFVECTGAVVFCPHWIDLESHHLNV
ncbi:hypothetical protein D3C74_396610 [compost metagenome]